ncbi:MAG: sensor domain-containing protein [Clostridium sp.]
MGTHDKTYTEEQIAELEDIRLKYNTLLETVPYITWFMDMDGKYRDVNNEFLKHSGKVLDQVTGRNHKEVWEFKKGNECETNDRVALKYRKEMKFREIVFGANGYRGFDVYRRAVVSPTGELKGIMAVAKDITEIKNREVQFKVLIESLPFSIWQYDMKGNIIISNTNFAKYFNMSIDEMREKNIEEVYEGEFLEQIKKENRDIISKKEPIKIIKTIKKNHKKYILEIYKIPVFNIVNEVVGIVGSCMDITEVVEAKERVRMQAYTDYNTGLLNRRALYEHINNGVKFKPKTVIILDVDNFKNINDTYGHHVGDSVLLKIAEALKEINEDGKVFRFGGDEFLIVYDEQLGKNEIEKKSKKILDYISKIKIENEHIAVSLGIATCGCQKKCLGKQESGECRLIIKADIALYNAKKYKKSTYVIYTEKLEEEMLFISKMEKDLSHIIERDELKLVYQPQYTTDGKVIGFEALFRWKNDAYKKTSIQDIIETMEKNKLIIQVGHEIIKKACVFAKKINENRKDKIIVSFNVSAVQLMEENFTNEVKAIIEETGVDTDSIGIEITETVIIEDIHKSVKKLSELKDLGIKISLDDFGTGYSSFNYLVKLPLSVVKIDRSFSIEMEGYEKYITLIKLIVDASHSLNLSVVAEGVETKEQLKVLKNIGVEYIQGYLFSKPLEEDKAMELLN